MVRSLVPLLLLSCLALLSLQNAEADWVDPDDLMVPFMTESYYAGYLKANNKQFFYALHESQRNPKKDPVVIWFGSGPGCSALYSMFYSKGPYIFTRNTSLFKTNNYTWNKEANVVFIESPGEVGFSMGTGNSSDKQLSGDHLEALLSFYAKFPNLKDQDLYFAGEGYAGIYIPFLANKITEHNSDPLVLPDQHILLKGIFLGNPCTDHSECQNNTRHNPNSYQYLKNHYFYSPQQYAKYKSACLGIYTAECAKVIEKMDTDFNITGVNRRNIFEECLEQQTGNHTHIPCLDQIGIQSYLNTPSIRKALHVNVSDEKVWEICNSEVTMNFDRDSRGSYFLYPSLIKKYRVVIYSGALDASNPISGTLKWIQNLREDQGLAALKPWSAWEMDGINGGEIWKLNGLTFVSVRSAGHMVFTDQQQLGFYLYQSFLKNTL